MSSILIIDGENFRKKTSEVLNLHGIVDVEWDKFDVAGLFSAVLFEVDLSRRTYYAAKIDYYPETAEQSKRLIEQQRRLKTNLEKHGYLFEISGHVRCHEGRCPAGHAFRSYKEKGVDVKIGVDIVVSACDGEVKTVFLCCSDSDLQPAVKEARKRGQQVVYIGFERNPNKGLVYTCSRTVLIRDTEILSHYPSPTL